MIFNGFIMAMRTLTILPIPGREAERPTHALYFFPVVGAIIGGLIQLAAWAFAFTLNWLAGAAFIGVAVSVGLTRALHLDGLSDATDACLASRSRERRLEIMKDPHIGAFGATAIMLALLCKFVSLERLGATAHFAWIAAPVILARTVMVLAAASLPYARREGGKAQPFIEEARPVHFWVACVLAVALCMFLAGSAGLLATAVAFTVGLLAVRWMKRSFGGVTGDLLGFTGEITECVLYLVLAAITVLG